MKLKERLIIDKNNLDNEVVQQPELYRKAGRAAAMAASVRDLAKYEMEAACAEADARIRAAMGREGEKVTEALVKARVLLDKTYRAAQRRYLDARLAADNAEVDKESFAQRAWMMKEIVSLHNANYYADATITATARDHHTDERVDERRREIKRKRQSLREAR